MYECTANICDAQDACASALYDTSVVWQEIRPLATRAHVCRIVGTIGQLTLIVVGWAWLKILLASLSLVVTAWKQMRCCGRRLTEAIKAEAIVYCKRFYEA